MQSSSKIESARSVNSQQAQNMAAWLRFFVKTWLCGPAPFAMQHFFLSGLEWMAPNPDGASIEKVRLAEVPCEIVVPAGAQSEESSCILVYLHGGGFVVASPRMYRNLTVRLAGQCGLLTYVPDYRLAPGHPYPAQIDDVLAVFGALADRGIDAGRIILGGDSAGGNLALAVVTRLKREGRALPRALLLLSPWADISCSNPMPDNVEGTIPRAWLDRLALAYAPRTAWDDPLVSPIHADFSAFPRTLIMLGGDEILSLDGRRLHAAMIGAGVKAECAEWPGMWHSFPVFAGFVPEATQALERAGEFVRNAAGQEF